MKDNLTYIFIIQILKITDIMVFLGIANLLGVNTQEGETVRDFADVLEDVIVKFESKPRSKQKEIISLIKKANKVKGDSIYGKD